MKKKKRAMSSNGRMLYRFGGRLCGMWPAGFERSKTLRLATIGRKTGRRHEVTINFVADERRLFVSTADNSRDWVRNLLKNPSCEVTISKVTRKLAAAIVQSENERESVRQLYRRKYGLFYRLRPLPKESIIFELKPTAQPP